MRGRSRAPAREAELRGATPRARHPSPRWRATALRLLLPASVALPGCELTEVVLAEPEDLVVAEVLVQVRDDRGFGDVPEVFALLHRTGSAEGVGVPGARVVIFRSDGARVQLVESKEPRDCVWSSPPGYGATCYSSPDRDEPRFRPGEALRLQIELPGGGRLEGAVVIPSDFRFLGTFAGGFPPACGLPADTTLELRWTGAQGAWAYVAETAISDIRAAMRARGIEMERDDLHLMGLAISAADTTIVFPAEFGLLERFGDGQELLVALQGGLPPGGNARVTVSAVERNYVNWARGGNFNPSGTVRVPSLRGDGTGFFGAAVVRTLQLFVGAGPGVPTCR